LFRYRGTAKDGGTLEYVFDGGAQNSPIAITKEKAAEIAADFMATFYHVQVGTLETEEFRKTPAPSALSAFHTRSRTDAPDLFRRSAAGWDGCSAEIREAPVVGAPSSDVVTFFGQTFRPPTAP
jgi:hypothetical protein